MADPSLDALRAGCARSLTYHGPKHDSLAATLRELAGLATEEARKDLYGEGALIEDFEREIAALLGKEAAVFMPSGTMAQQIALRIWADRRGRRAIGFHPLCHLEIHEEKAYQRLHGLSGVHIGSPHRRVTLDAVKGVKEPLAALVLELPQRGIGGQLPGWEELAETAALARERGWAMHLDGARLWETGPFYGRPYSEIGSLFDTVYVSFYKGLGGIAGCALAGPGDVIAEARIWQRRHGGNLVHLYPYVLAARAGMAARLPKMAAYVAKAQEVAARIGALAGVEIVPDPPQTNMMHAYLRGDQAKLEAAGQAIARERRVWLFGKLQASPVPGWSLFEINIGDGALELSADEIGSLFEELFARAVG